MTSAKTDATKDISEALEACRTRLEQDFLEKTRELEQRRQERIARLEELTQETLKTVDHEWDAIREEVLQEASARREEAFSRLGKMLGSFDREGVYRDLLQSAISRILAEPEREESEL